MGLLGLSLQAGLPKLLNFPLYLQTLSFWLVHSNYLQSLAGAFASSPPELQWQKPRHTVILGLVLSAFSLEFSSKMYF